MQAGQYQYREFPEEDGEESINKAVAFSRSAQCKYQ
jgi:hypothetical protein